MYYVYSSKETHDVMENKKDTYDLLINAREAQRLTFLWEVSCVIKWLKSLKHDSP